MTYMRSYFCIPYGITNRWTDFMNQHKTYCTRHKRQSIIRSISFLLYFTEETLHSGKYSTHFSPLLATSSIYVHLLSIVSMISINHSIANQSQIHRSRTTTT